MLHYSTTPSVIKLIFTQKVLPHEAISVFDIFKIGVGPSSSHTLGPWRAAQRFVSHIDSVTSIQSVKSLRVLLYGSLAKTGIGHGTDVAVQLGLSGHDPVTCEVDAIGPYVSDIKKMRRLLLSGVNEIEFDPAEDISFFIS